MPRTTAAFDEKIITGEVKVSRKCAAKGRDSSGQHLQRSLQERPMLRGGQVPIREGIRAAFYGRTERLTSPTEDSATLNRAFAHPEWNADLEQERGYDDEVNVSQGHEKCLRSNNDSCLAPVVVQHGQRSSHGSEPAQKTTTAATTIPRGGRRRSAARTRRRTTPASANGRNGRNARQCKARNGTTRILWRNRRNWWNGRRQQPANQDGYRRHGQHGRHGAPIL